MNIKYILLIPVVLCIVYLSLLIKDYYSTIEARQDKKDNLLTDTKMFSIITIIVIIFTIYFSKNNNIFYNVTYDSILNKLKMNKKINKKLK